MPQFDTNKHALPPDKVLRNISSLFIKSSVFNAQATLYEALSQAGVALNADRASLLRLIPSSHKLITLAQWVSKAEYFSPTGLEGYSINLDQFPFLKTFIKKPRPLVLNHLGELDAQAEKEKAELKHDNIRSIMAFPVYRGSRPIGCVTLSTIGRDRSWQPGEISFMENLAEMFSLFLERAEHEADRVIVNDEPSAQPPHSTPEDEQYLRQSKIVSQAGLDLMHMHGKDQILAYTAETLKNIFPKSVISVSDYNEKTRHITVRHLKGIDGRIAKTFDLLGIKPEGKTYYLDPGEKASVIMHKSVLHRIEGGLHDATLKSLGKIKSRILEKICGVKSVYGAGLHANGKLLGTAVLVLRDESPVLESLMEGFIRMVSIAIFRVETQQELILSRNYLQNILGSMTEGVVEIDLKGEIKYVNKAVRYFTGFSQKNFMHSNVSDFLATPQDREVLFDNTINTLPENRRCFELKVAARNGRHMEVLVNTIMVKNSMGEPRGFLGVLTDLSALREHDRIIRDMALNEQLLEFKQQFLSNMSHEMLTPINGIMGVAHLLGSKLTSQEDRELLSLVSNSTSQLLRVIKSIWEANGLNHGALALAEKEFSLCSFIHQNVTLFAASAHEKEVYIRIICKRTDDYLLLADEFRINQVLTNLIGNAIKFQHEGGQIDVHCDIQINPDNSAGLRIEVKDNGPGIPQEKQNNLFKLFEQVDNSNTRRHDGLGLGLHLCRQLVTLMGGQMGFDSQPGTGSNFWFEVPVTVLDLFPITCSSKCMETGHKNFSIKRTGFLPGSN